MDVTFYMYVHVAVVPGTFVYAISSSFFVVFALSSYALYVCILTC